MRRRCCSSKWASGNRAPTILAGDFNFDPSSDRNPVARRLVTDDYQADCQTWHLLADLGRDIGRAGPATAILGRRIDRVIVPLTVECVAYDVLRGKRWRRMDHRPVVARLRIASDK